MTARCENGGRSRPVMRDIEVTRRGQIRDKRSKDLLSPHEICREYNEMLFIVQQVAVLGCAEHAVVEQSQLLLRHGPAAVARKRAVENGGLSDGK